MSLIDRKLKRHLNENGGRRYTSPTRNSASDISGPSNVEVPSRSIQTRKQCSRIRILRFFRFKKKHDFLRFLKWRIKKIVKSR